MDNIPTDIKEVLDRFTGECINMLGNRVKKIILYGSYARGDYNNSSDIDILILTDYEREECYNAFKKISEMTYGLDLEYDVILMPLINNINDFNNGVECVPFYINVQKEGIILKE